MENQETQEKKGFSLRDNKKKVIIICLAVVFLACNIGFRMAGTRDMGFRYSLISGARDYAVAVKDFEPLGIVSAETSASGRNGYGATYHALIKEASQKGADAIINVSILPTSGAFTKTWSGSALAVKYLDTRTP